MTERLEKRLAQQRRSAQKYREKVLMKKNNSIGKQNDHSKILVIKK